MLSFKKNKSMIKMIKILKLLIFLLILSTAPFLEATGQAWKPQISGQVSSRQAEKAKKAFDNLAFPRAIRIYERLNAKGRLNVNDKSFLAIAYMKTNQPEKAAEVFDPIDKEKLHGEPLYYYARALQSTGRHREADWVMSRYHEESPNDERAEKQKNSSSFFETTTKKERYIVELAGFNSKQSDFAPLIQNGVMYFTSARDINPLIKRQTARGEEPYLNVFRAERRENNFADPQLYSTDFRTRYHDGPICFNTNGTEIFITRNSYHSKSKEDGFNHLKIVYSARKSNGNWTKPVDMPFNDPSFSCGHPFLTKDGNRLYFVSDRPGGEGGSDIYYVDLNNRGWSQPVNAGDEINTKGDELFPFMDENGRFYFTSNGHLGLGGLDIFAAEKINNKYVIKNMGYPLNSIKDDFSIFVNPDGQQGFFASNRQGGKGDDDIYKFTIFDPITFSAPVKPVPEPKETYTGILIDQKTGEAIPQAIVGILDSKGKYIKEVTTNESGIFSLPDSLKGSITAMTAVEHYHPHEETLTLNNTKDTLYLALRPKPVYGIYGKVLESDTKNPISDLTIIISSTSFDNDTVYTDNDGEFRARLYPYTNFEIVFQKNGYKTKTISYSTIRQDVGYVNLNNRMSLKMEKDTNR